MILAYFAGWQLLGTVYIQEFQRVTFPIQTIRAAKNALVKLTIHFTSWTSTDVLKCIDCVLLDIQKSSSVVETQQLKFNMKVHSLDCLKGIYFTRRIIHMSVLKIVLTCTTHVHEQCCSYMSPDRSWQHIRDRISSSLKCVIIRELSVSFLIEICFLRYIIHRSTNKCHFTFVLSQSF